MKKGMPQAYTNLVFEKNITQWDEAISLGNGLCGALIWGDSNGLRFSLDRGDIWDNTPFEGVFSEEFTYENMVRLAREGKEEEIRRIFDAPYNHLVPTKLPAGKLIFDFLCNENVRSELDLSKAEALITIGDKIHLPSTPFRWAAPQNQYSSRRRRTLRRQAIQATASTARPSRVGMDSPLSSL